MAMQTLPSAIVSIGADILGLAVFLGYIADLSDTAWARSNNATNRLFKEETHLFRKHPHATGFLLKHGKWSMGQSAAQRLAIRISGDPSFVDANRKTWLALVALAGSIITGIGAYRQVLVDLGTPPPAGMERVANQDKITLVAGIATLVVAILLAIYFLRRDRRWRVASKLEIDALRARLLDGQVQSPRGRNDDALHIERASIGTATPSIHTGQLPVVPDRKSTSMSHRPLLAAGALAVAAAMIRRLPPPPRPASQDRRLDRSGRGRLPRRLGGDRVTTEPGRGWSLATTPAPVTSPPPVEVT